MCACLFTSVFTQNEIKFPQPNPLHKHNELADWKFVPFPTFVSLNVQNINIIYLHTVPLHWGHKPNNNDIQSKLKILILLVENVVFLWHVRGSFFQLDRTRLKETQHRPRT